jgi:hypothetical protein
MPGRAWSDNAGGKLKGRSNHHSKYGILIALTQWWLFRPEDVKKLKNWCEKISALKKVAPGCPVSDRWGIGIHFASAEISAKSISSHLPVPDLLRLSRICSDLLSCNRCAAAAALRPLCKMRFFRPTEIVR